MTLGELRTVAADALIPLSVDWTVHPAPVDAVEPPAFVLAWSDPWLTPATFCTSYAQLEVIVVAGRLEPDTQYETLEAMVEGAYRALDSLTIAQTATPLPFESNGLQFLAARILIRQPVDLPGGS